MEDNDNLTDSVSGNDASNEQSSEPVTSSGNEASPDPFIVGDPVKFEDSGSPYFQQESDDLGSPQEFTSSDGAVIRSFPDGSTEIVNADGSTMHMAEDGATTITTAEGASLTTFSDGTRETVTEDGITTSILPDGTIEANDPQGNDIDPKELLESSSDSNEATAGDDVNVLDYAIPCESGHLTINGGEIVMDLLDGTILRIYSDSAIHTDENGNDFNIRVYSNIDGSKCVRTGTDATITWYANGLIVLCEHNDSLIVLPDGTVFSS